MLLCLGCLYIYSWLFSQELDKHCKATVHKLFFFFFFSSEQLLVLTFSIILQEKDSFVHLFIHLFIYFGMCMTAWRMAALHMNASVLM